MRPVILLALFVVVVLAPLIGVYALSPFFFAWGLEPYLLAVSVAVMLAEAASIAALYLLVVRARKR